MTESEQAPLQLRYTAINIATAERQYGVSFFDTFGRLGDKPSVSDIVFLLRAGGAPDDQVDAHFDQGLTHCFELIISALGESGFLGKAIDAKAAIEDLRKAESKSSSTATSTGTGKA